MVHWLNLTNSSSTLHNSLIYHYITIAKKRFQNSEKTFFTQNTKTAKSIAHEIFIKPIFLQK
ncbi:hypothetical protein T03_1561 [Trichinella britovi]|uniref:Uncharacterized protein n=1 Tax=Trichinella britovi TaxID=45882 RepID=A0A0V1CH40_TRIBR|nr:hypothetical protein T03_1561 [Trichinella britovi]